VGNITEGIVRRQKNNGFRDRWDGEVTTIPAHFCKTIACGTIWPTQENPMKRAFAAMAVVAFLVGVVQAAEKVNLAKPAGKAESWRLEQHEGGKGTLKIDGDAAVFQTTETSTESWHVQATMSGFDFKEGKDYEVSFKAKADPARTIHLNAMIDKDDWHPIGLSEDIDMTKEWKDYKFTFKAEGVATESKNRISFMLGADKGTLSIKDLTITEK
jgi:hypothetical protein